MIKDLMIERLIVDDIKHQLSNAEGEIINGEKESANYRLKTASCFCANLAKRLADAIEETS